MSMTPAQTIISTLNSKLSLLASWAAATEGWLWPFFPHITEQSTYVWFAGSYSSSCYQADIWKKKNLWKNTNRHKMLILTSRVFNYYFAAQLSPCKDGLPSNCTALQVWQLRWEVPCQQLNPFCDFLVSLATLPHRPSQYRGTLAQGRFLQAFIMPLYSSCILSETKDCRVPGREPIVSHQTYLATDFFFHLYCILVRLRRFS